LFMAPRNCVPAMKKTSEQVRTSFSSRIALALRPKMHVAYRDLASFER
jgi:hypothetical protein